VAGPSPSAERSRGRHDDAGQRRRDTARGDFERHDTIQWQARPRRPDRTEDRPGQRCRDVLPPKLASGVSAPPPGTIFALALNRWVHAGSRAGSRGGPADHLRTEPLDVHVCIGEDDPEVSRTTAPGVPRRSVAGAQHGAVADRDRAPPVVPWRRPSGAWHRLHPDVRADSAMPAPPGGLCHRSRQGTTRAV
jgi:hypothetical protein